jgi:photosystem II stability/assembly factor-like uncharacterized protein
MKQSIQFLVMASIYVACSVAQQAHLTRVATLTGPADSTTFYQFRCVEYLSHGIIWISAAGLPYKGDNYVCLSTDDGATWAKRTVYTNAALATPGITGLASKDGNTAFISLSTGEILRTINAGVKWDTVSSYSTADVAFCGGVRYVGQDTLVAYGDADAQGVFVTRSVDGGKTWSRNLSLPSDSLRADGLYASYVSYGQGMESFGKTAWATLYNTANDPPSILKTTDGGVTWSWFRVTLPSGPALGYLMRSITFEDASVGFAVSRRAYSSSSVGDNYLTKTTDGGRTWSDTISVEPGKAHANAKPMTAKTIRGTNTVIAVGCGLSGSKAWISNDKGLTWSALDSPTPNPNADLRNLAFGSTTQGIMVGTQNIVKINMLTVVEDNRGVNPTRFALEQNYPNPFNPSTKINYSIPKTSFVELKIVDLLGRTVRTLVNGEQGAGEHSVVFDAKGLSSGVYFYKMNAGDLAATKSLMLVK